MAEAPQGDVALGMVCDGVGGLSNGEIASGHVVRTFSKWFDEELEEALLSSSPEGIKMRWKELLTGCNGRILSHGMKTQTKLGTTATALLILPGGDYIIAHIGDSKIFAFGNGIRVLTVDHTVTGVEVRAGRMTAADAAKDPRKSVLTQCIGAADTFMADFASGKANSKDLFLLCSDGFSNRISEQELQRTFTPLRFGSGNIILKNALSQVAETCKGRGERDNITGLAIGLI
jgi:serine/threonine protein phosphatase PrpC